MFLNALQCLRRENDKLRSVNSHLKSWSEKQTASKTALKESLLSRSCRADIAENQTQNVMVQVAELKWQLNSQSCRISYVKIRSLVGEKMRSLKRGIRTSYWTSRN